MFGAPSRAVPKLQDEHLFVLSMGDVVLGGGPADPDPLSDLTDRQIAVGRIQGGSHQSQRWQRAGGGGLRWRQAEEPADVAALERAAGGGAQPQVSIGGQSFCKQAQREQLDQVLLGVGRDIGFMFQNDAVFPWKSVMDNVLAGPRFRSRPPDLAREQARDWLRQVSRTGLEDRYGHQLSGGTRKRVARAQSLINEPRIHLRGRARRPTHETLRATEAHIATESCSLSVPIGNLSPHHQRRPLWSPPTTQ
jgi:ABC-type uncharacterized transport system YnjBCD ATPase subunit